MQRYLDYHVHTDNSIDCKFPMSQMCQSAVDHNLMEIAFTDHFNNHPLDNDAGIYDPHQFFEDIEFCRAKYPTLKVRAGVEVGEPHRWGSKILPVLERYPYDVVLGSLHWVGNESMFDPAYFRANSAEKVFNTYFSELAAMVRHGGFEILTHVDVPKRTASKIYGGFDTCAFESVIREVWQACIDHNVTPEINTKGLRSAAKEVHPAPVAMQWYAEMGGKALTFGSDAHHPDQIALDFDVASGIATSVGIKQVCQYERRSIAGWVDITNL